MGIEKENLNRPEEVPLPSESNISVEKNQEEIKELAFYEGSMRDTISHTPAGMDAREYMANHWLYPLQKSFFPEEAEENIQQVSEKLRTGNFESSDDLAHQTAVELQRVRAQYMSQREAENRIRAYRMEHNEKATPLTENNLFYYDKQGQEIRLHIGPAFAMPLGEKLRSFREAMPTLAQHLNTKEGLKDINAVSVALWIVEQHPELIRKAGFTLEDTAVESHSQHGFPRAAMTKDDFLKRYLKEEK